MPQNVLRTRRNDWSQRIEQDLRSVHEIGDKLIAGRRSCTDPAAELILIAQEAKLIRHVSRIIYLNELHNGTKYPVLGDWLSYVNLLPAEVVELVQYLQSFCSLVATNDKQLLDICENLHFTSESRRRLRKSSYSLRGYVAKWRDDGHEPSRAFSDRSLAWMSFDHLLPIDSAKYHSENTVDSSASESGSAPGSNISQLSLPTTTPPASPHVRMTTSALLGDNLRVTGGKKSVPNCLTAAAIADGLTRSHSHESNLQYGVNNLQLNCGMVSSRSINDCLSVTSRPSTLCASGAQLYTNRGASTITKSPKTARTMHSIPHQWHRRKGFRIATENCHFCQRQLSFLSEYDKCKSCKWKVHSQCKEKIGDSCGLTPAYLKEALKEMFLKDSGKDGWTPSANPQHMFAFDSIDSSSSTNSSAPSTPAFPAIHSTSYMGTSGTFLLPSAPPSSYRSNFDFPEPVPEVPDIIVDTGLSDHQHLVSSQGSDVTMNSGCTLGPGISERSLFIESIGSNSSNSEEKQDESSLNLVSCSLNRDRWSNGTIRVPNSWNDVTISFNQIEFKKPSLIGKGRFGEVHKAHWYGDVAVKFLNMDHVDEDRQLEAFKAEVASFKNTRHDNIVLLMGYCLDQHKLGIVMYFCKGRPLHQMLHEHHENLDFSQIVYFAMQICQGVSYLHTKRIIHKDLRTKNIFVESRDRIVITDFGLVSMRRLLEPHRDNMLLVPEHWLSYLAPEIVKILSEELVHLPFSEMTDVFSFGTVWYELMTRQFPFNGLHPDIVIWRVGKGIKGPLGNIRASREVKEISMRCWNYAASERPTFRELFTMLEHLPKKRLHRSPSFPVSRSYESVF